MVTIVGDIRDKKTRDALKPHLKTGVVLENPNLSEWGCKLSDGSLSVGSAAFAHLLAAYPEAMTRICGTCRKWEPESGYCIMWCRPTESIAKCEHWAPEGEDRN